jgi:hypothetical protein
VAIIVDTLNRSLQGSESDDEDMGNYVKAADRLREAFDCAVIVIHHSGIEGNRPRGHTSLAGAADAQIAVKRENGEVVLYVELMKDGPIGDKIASKLEAVEIGFDEDGEPMTSCIVLPSAGHRVGGGTLQLSDRLRHARKLLEGVIEHEGQVIDEPDASRLLPNRVKAVKIEIWRKECYLSLPVDSTAGSEAEQQAKRKAFLRVRKDLADKSVIKESDGWVWLVA